MRWRGRRKSQNVEDRRGMPGPSKAGRGRFGFPGRRLPGRRVSFGGGLLGLIVILLYIFMGGDPAVFLQQAQQQAQRPGPAPASRVEPATAIPADDVVGDFVEVVLGYTEDVWAPLFQQVGSSYVNPRLVLFSGRVESACGFATAAVGPFYCPADKTVYLDTQFFEQLRSELGAPGDFAMAYVIAHEVGHHVQNQLGSMDQVHGRQRRVSEAESNRLSVRLELQADFLAGVWAHHAEKMNQILEPGDLREAMDAATAIGDDRLQKSSRGYVVPDSFTHGTSAQRLRWFRRGFETGDMRQMNQLFEQAYDAL